MTGGLKRTPGRMCTVTVLLPFEYFGIAEARSGIALIEFGRYDNSGRWVAYEIS